MNEKLKETINKIKLKLDEADELRTENFTMKEKIVSHKKDKLKEIDDYFTHLEETLNNRRKQLKEEFNELCDKELKGCQSEEVLLNELYNKLQNGIINMNSILSDFESQKIIGENNEKKIEEYEDLKEA